MGFDVKMVERKINGSGHLLFTRIPLYVLSPSRSQGEKKSLTTLKVELQAEKGELYLSYTLRISLT